jgi:hypothetical protein
MKYRAASSGGLPGRQRSFIRGRRIMYSIAAAVWLAVILLVTVPRVIARPVESVHASIAVPVVVVETKERGYIDELLVKTGDRVRTGDPILTLRRRAEPRAQFSLTSPCECTVVELLIKRGSEALAEEPLALLAFAGSDKLMVEAAFPADAKMTLGAPVKILVEGASQPGRGRIIKVNASSLAADLYGLPRALTEGYQLVIVGQLEGFDAIRPGMSARVQLIH